MSTDRTLTWPLIFCATDDNPLCRGTSIEVVPSLWQIFNVRIMDKNLDTQRQDRTLLYFPIIHTQNDMGSFRDLVRDASLKKLGKDTWHHKVQVIKAMWEEIEHVIDGMNLDFHTVRVYQDGLPVCGYEAEIVTELAGKGSLNHLLLLRLQDRGATIMGTESAELLVKEYNLTKRILEANNAEGAKIEASPKELMELLLEKRNQFIAKRIDTTLLDKETGILFLGMLHSLEDRLNTNIRVLYPIGRPHNHVGV